MTSNLKSKVSPLTWNVPIVNKDGTPTNEFMRKWQAQSGVNGLIPGQITTPEQVSAILDILGADQGDVLYRSAAGWVVLTPGAAGELLVTGGTAGNPAWDGISAILDTLGGTQGDTLYRNGTDWTVLPAGTNGQVLTYDTTLHAPKWASGGGGGGVTIGTGAPTALEPAGTPYSQDDAAGFWVSTPTTTAGTGVVQFGHDIHGNSGVGSIALPAAPTVGNLIMVFINWGNNSSAQPTVDTTNWTQFITIAGTGGNISGFAVYRYAQFGDAAALPAITTSGGNYWSAMAYEVSGVSGTFATDVEYSDGTYVVNNTITTASHNTASAGALGIVSGGQYDGSSNPTVSTGWGVDYTGNNSGNYGSLIGASQIFGASGSAVQATLGTTYTSSYATNAFQVIVAGSSPVSTAGWTQIGAGGGGGSPDFLVPTAASFTAHGNSPVMTDNPVGLGLSSPGNGGSNMYWAGQTQANVNFTILARVTQGVLTDFTGEFGIFVRNTTSGKFLTAVISENTAVKLEQWNSDTSKNGDVANVGNILNGFCWIKLTYNATSNLTSAFFSRDGVNWIAVGTDSTFVGAVDQIGICAPCQSGLNCPANGAVHYWKVT